MEQSQLEMFSLSKTQVVASENPNWEIENNLLWLPIFGFHKGGANAAKFRQVRDVPIVVGNEMVVREVIVAVGTRVVKDKAGNAMEVSDHLPIGFDMVVLYALIGLWDDQGRHTDGRVRFSLSDFCRRLELNARSGKNFSRIKESIYRLGSVTIHIDQAFYSPSENRHISTQIGLLEKNITFVEDVNHAGRNLFSVRLGEALVKNLRVNFSTKINRALFLRLSSGFAQRILSLAILNRGQLDREGVITFSLRDLILLLPMVDSKYPSRIIARLKPSIQELNEKRVLKCEFSEIDGLDVLSISKIFGDSDAFVGIHRIEDFFQMLGEARGKPLEAILKMEKSSIERFISENIKPESMFGSSKYSRVFFVLDVIAHQVLCGYESKDTSALLVHLMKPTSKVSPRPDYRPFDQVCFEKRKEKAMKALVEKNRQSESSIIEADAKINELAREAFRRLRPDDVMEYVHEIAKAESGNGMIRDRARRFVEGKDATPSAMLESFIVGAIALEMREGRFKKRLLRDESHAIDEAKSIPNLTSQS